MSTIISTLCVHITLLMRVICILKYILPSLIYKEGFAYAHITLFDIPSLMRLKSNYSAFNMYLDKQYTILIVLSNDTKIVKIFLVTELP